MSLTVTISILIVNSVYNGIMFMKRGIDILAFILFTADSSLRHGSGKFLIFSHPINLHHTEQIYINIRKMFTPNFKDNALYILNRY